MRRHPDPCERSSLREHVGVIKHGGGSRYARMVLLGYLFDPILCMKGVILVLHLTNAGFRSTTGGDLDASRGREGGTVLPGGYECLLIPSAGFRTQRERCDGCGVVDVRLLSFSSQRERV